MEHSSTMMVLTSWLSFPPDLFRVKLLLIHPLEARKEWIVVDRSPVCVLMRSAALPVGAIRRKPVLSPWTRLIFSTIARITVVLPVPAAPERTQRGLVKIFMQISACLSRIASYCRPALDISLESFFFRRSLNFSALIARFRTISGRSVKALKASSMHRSSS